MYRRTDQQNGQDTVTSFYVGSVEVMVNEDTLQRRYKSNLPAGRVKERIETDDGSLISENSYYIFLETGKRHPIFF